MISEAWRIELTEDATVPELELVQAMTGHEAVYGCPDKPEVWVGSGNHGAYQHKCPPCATARHLGQPWNPLGGCFSAKDSSPNDDGSSTSYDVCLRSYKTHLDGIRDVVRWIRRHARTLAAVRTGLVLEFSTALRADGYYQGFGPTEEVRIANHAKSITKWVNAIRRGLTGTEEVYPSNEVVLTGFTWQTLIDEAADDMRRERDDLVRGDGE
jgi:hypothetical protein